MSVLFMTRDEFIYAVERFEKLERTQREFSNEIDKVLCKIHEQTRKRL